MNSTRYSLTELTLGILALLMSMGLILLGLAIPSHFRSVAPSVLETVEDEGLSLSDLTEQYLKEGNPGMASVLMSQLAKSTESSELQKQREKLLNDFPHLRWTGGSAPFYQPFVESHQLDPNRVSLLSSLIPETHREWMLDYLRESPNRAVQAILNTRELSDYKLFLPVFSNAGQPLDATILITALARQSGQFSKATQDRLDSLVQSANEGDPKALDELELFYVSILTFGQRLNWSPFAEWLGNLETKEDWVYLTEIIQSDSRYLNISLSAMALHGEPPLLITYLKRWGQPGWDAIERSLAFGSEGLKTLIEFDKPLYQPAPILDWLPESLRWEISFLDDFVKATPRLALATKAFLQGLAGMLLIYALLHLLPIRQPRGTPQISLLLRLDKLIGGIALMIGLFVLIEPSLLNFQPNESGKLKLNLAQVLPSELESNATSPDNNPMIDQVTLLILIFFFVVQLFVFVFCLIKINEIRRQPVDSETKLKLIDNEENLFDLGLYIGLGGTVSSLIFIVLNFVDASLMAAYASTLFGILFVAVLKVGFLRPFRKRVILNQNRPQDS